MGEMMETKDQPTKQFNVSYEEGDAVIIFPKKGEPRVIIPKSGNAHGLITRRIAFAYAVYMRAISDQDWKREMVGWLERTVSKKQ